MKCRFFAGKVGGTYTNTSISRPNIIKLEPSLFPHSLNRQVSSLIDQEVNKCLTSPFSCQLHCKKKNSYHHSLTERWLCNTYNTKIYTRL